MVSLLYNSGLQTSMQSDLLRRRVGIRAAYEVLKETDRYSNLSHPGLRSGTPPPHHCMLLIAPSLHWNSGPINVWPVGHWFCLSLLQAWCVAVQCQDHHRTCWPSSSCQVSTQGGELTQGGGVTTYTICDEYLWRLHGYEK